MNLQQPVENIPCGGVGVAPAASSLASRYCAVQSKLTAALEKKQPITLMMGADSFELGHIIGTFLSDSDMSATSVRLREPLVDALTALREINLALGFDPKDLSISDLQSVLHMFLEYQNKHKRRTILCVEKADEQCMWLLDCIAGLISAHHQVQSESNLMVVLAGSENLNKALQNAALEGIRKEAGAPIKVAPFSIFETREFIRQLTDTAGRGDIQSLFEFDAVERLHRITGGVPHRVARLCRECVAIVDRDSNGPATGRTVVRAARILRAEANLDMEMAVVNGSRRPDSTECDKRLLIRRPGRPLMKVPLHPGRYMIGRTVTADIRLESPLVSRRHALLIEKGEDLQFIDLGSVNGSFNGEERISKLTLAPGMVLRLGDCEIEYQID